MNAIRDRKMLRLGVGMRAKFARAVITPSASSTLRSIRSRCSAFFSAVESAAVFKK